MEGRSWYYVYSGRERGKRNRGRAMDKKEAMFALKTKISRNVEIGIFGRVEQRILPAGVRGM
jgi:outer membrane protein assembly factor BamE (lipoprotein component of BamABCDE complex)